MPVSVNPRDYIKRTELRGTKALSFPPEIDGVVPNFFELKFVNYDRNATLKRSSQSPNNTTIFLPVPINLTDQTNLDYTEYKSFGGIDNLLENGTVSGASANLPDTAGGFMQAMILGGARYLPDAAATGIGRRLGLNGVGDLGSRVGKVLQTQAGALINPALAVEFHGVQRKSYQFSWRMIARSQRESLVIADIIDNIRWNILPEKVSGDWILTYPNIAFMKFHGNLEYGTMEAPRQLIQFAPQGAVVTSMTVTYNGQSTQQVFYADSGEPVEVTISLALEDRGILTREMVGKR